MIKEKYNKIRALLVSCKYAENDSNGNSRFEIIIIAKYPTILNKVFSGICKDSHARFYKNDNINSYSIQNVTVSFYITYKNKVIFTEIGECL